MKRFLEAVRSSKVKVTTVEQQMEKYFWMNHSQLKDFKGTLHEAALAHAVIGMKDARCVCPSVDDEQFDDLRRAVMACPQMPEKPEDENEGGGDEDTDSKGG